MLDYKRGEQINFPICNFMGKEELFSLKVVESIPLDRSDYLNGIVWGIDNHDTLHKVLVFKSGKIVRYT